MEHHFEPFNSTVNIWLVVSSHFWSKMAGDNRLSAAVAKYKYCVKYWFIRQEKKKEKCKPSFNFKSHHLHQHH